MEQRFERTRLLLGKEAMDRLKKARVAVFGIGGVGGYVVEALARSGVGAIDLIDKDRVSESNINRQIIATNASVGQYKTDVMKERILNINPEARVRVHPYFFLPENQELFDFSGLSYIADAVDTVSAKIALVLQAQKYGIPIISSMGAGNKLDPTAFRVADIYETRVCPLARVLRRELRKRNIAGLKVVYSEEEPVTPVRFGETETLEACEVRETGKDRIIYRNPCEENGRPVPGSVAFVPSVAGLIMAGEIIKALIKG